MDIVLYILAALITAVELFSNKKPFNSRKNRTAAIFIFLLIGLYVTWIKDERTQKSDRKKDEQIASLKKDLKEKTDSIIISQIYLKNGTDYLRDNIDTLVTPQLKSLNSMLHSVEQKTLLAIEEREESIDAFKNVSEQLKKQANIEAMNLSSKAPEIEVFTNEVKWNRTLDPLDSSYTLSIKFKNFGNRVASNIKLKGIILFTDRSHKIVRHILLKEHENPNITLTPYHINGHSVKSNLFHISQEHLESEHRFGFILFKVEYDDTITNNSLSKYINLKWTNYGKAFSLYGGTDNEIIQIYLEEHMLEESLDINF